MICRGPKCTKRLRANERDLCGTCSFNLPLATIQEIRATPRTNGSTATRRPVIEGDGAVESGYALAARGNGRRS